MNIILKEKDEQEKISTPKAFIFILGFILAVNIFVAVLNRMKPLAAGLSGIVLIVAVVWVTYTVMSRKVTEYNYVLTDEGVVFEKVLGIREKAVLEIPFEDIEHIIPADQGREYGKYYFFLCNRRAEGKYILGYTDKGKSVGVIFRPSDKMVKGIAGKTGRGR
ncbi:MAG: hypothetical protein HPY66_0399 [Firmicutes bacterium]|nr:hypothetical protein [Bacillota bacterium]MDI6705098.1 hypothetical protein [Bacillota bacterium]